MRIITPQQKYLNEVFGLRDAELDRVREKLESQGVEFMAVAANEARILQFLIRSLGVRRIVEVGTLYGYSTLAMAKVLPSDGLIVTLEKDPKTFEIARETFASSPAGARVQALCGDALDTTGKAEEFGPFDMAFIDANKGGYVDYLNWAERNVKRGGLIVGDNTFLFGALWGEPRDREMSPEIIQTMREFNRRLADPEKYNSILIPTHEGMTVAQKLF